MNGGTLSGVSLGPGDPELITLKGLKKLRNADVILYPATDRTHKKSFSRKVLD
ncbi:MAG: SAM-dependent methyltransferase, partial [Bacteroidota bacterium]